MQTTTMSHTSPITIENTTNEVKQELSPEVVASANSNSVQRRITKSSKKVVITEQMDFRFKDNELKEKVAEILGIPISQGWSIEDTCDHLALVHYNDDSDDFDEHEHGNLRGILVDTEAGAVIANSFGYTPTQVAKSIHVVDGTLAIINDNNQEVVLNNFQFENTFIKRVFEGVVIRVIWHKGLSYRITHKKIKPLRSRWGSSPTFLSMYEAAGGPTDEQLFDTTKPYSDTCYTFLVSHPALLVGTRQTVNAPYIVCLTQFKMNINRPEEEIAPGLSNFPCNSDIKGNVSESFIHDPQTLTLEEANHHLRFGYYKSFDVEDERQLTGEAVIMYRMTNGEIADIVKIHSPSYDWRTTMRGNNPNIANQFYSMLNLIYKDINSNEGWDNLRKKLILFPLYDEQSLKDFYAENKAILTIPEGPTSKDLYRNRNDRIHLLWMNYVLALHSSVQGDGLNLLSNFYKDRGNLISFLIQLEATNKNIDSTDLPDRYKGLIKSSRNLARSRVQSGNNYSNGSYIKLPVLIKSTIRNLVNKENGPSLYALVRYMKQTQQAEQAAKQQVVQPVGESSE